MGEDSDLSVEQGEVLPITKVRDRLAELVNRAAYGKERLVFGRRGKPLVALIPVEDLEALEAIEDEIDLREGLRRLREWEARGRPTVPLEEVAARYGVDLGEPEA